MARSVVYFDASKLLALGATPLVPGDRVSCITAPTASSNLVFRQLNVVSRDTSVVSFDGEGTLFAHAPGSSWIVWQRGNRTDSTLVVVGGGPEAVPVPAAPPEPAAPPAPPEPPAPVAPSAPSAPSAPPRDELPGENNWVRPQLPARTVDVSYPVGRSGRSIRVPQGGDLQGALYAAQPGDEVVLAAGATFVGNYELPAKQGGSSDWIIVRSEVIPSAPGTRMTPEMALNVAKVVTPNAIPAIQTNPGARRWRLVGFEVAHGAGATYNYGVVVLSRGDERSLSDLSSDIILDRMYIHGSPNDAASRCVALNGMSQAVIDSWLSECHAQGGDAQGIAGWGGPGPFLIENNHIEASGEEILFGGSDPNNAGVIPSDITIRRNHLFKPLNWAGRWSVKAVFELKNARRVMFEGNVLENHWADAQNGFAILFQALSQDSQAPWTTVQDVTIQNNVIRNSTCGVNLLRRFNSVIQQGTSRIAVLNNLFQEVGRDPVSGNINGRVFQLLDEVEDVTFKNNTATLSGSAAHAMAFDGDPTKRSTVLNNVFPSTAYGIFGSGYGSGTSVIAHYMPGGVVSGNVLPGQAAAYYPANNYFPQSSAPAGGDDAAYACSLSRSWATQEGVPQSIGVDCTALAQATQGVVTRR